MFWWFFPEKWSYKNSVTFNQIWKYSINFSFLYVFFIMNYWKGFFFWNIICYDRSSPCRSVKVKSTLRFATLRLRRRPGRDGCQSALWEFLGGQIFRHVENASPKQSHNVWWALISFQEFDSCTQHHVYPALGKTSSAEEVFCRKLNAQWLWSLVMRVRKLSESQPRTQTSSRYPSYQRRLGTEYDSAKASSVNFSDKLDRSHPK